MTKREALDRIVMYTEAEPHTAKRIEYVLDKLLEKNIIVKKEIQIKEKIIHKPIKQIVYESEPTRKLRLHIDDWAEEWLKRHNLTRKEITKNNRQMHNVIRRREFSIDAKKAGYSLNEIKDYIGYSDHTSVLHLINTFKPIL